MSALVQNPTAPEWYAEVPRAIKRPLVLGFALIIFVFGGFMVWAATAPLAAAVIAPGSFVATGRNKIIQHLEGGIIDALLVREGDKVQPGTVLVKLDKTAAQANSRQLQLRQLRLEASLARLHAEAGDLDDYETPKGVKEHLSDSEIRAINDSQRENFRSARAKLQSELEVLQENITALDFQKNGLTSQIAAVEHQRHLLKEEYTAKSGLAKEGIVTRSAVRAIQRAIADADGSLARLRSDVNVSTAQIAKYRKQMIQTRDAAHQTALDEMQDVEAQLDAVHEQIQRADNVLDRTTIKSPVAGTVVRMYYHTPGGVIESGKPIMEILPSDVPLIIEARVPRTQIDDVHANQVANVRLTALNRRTTPVLEGKVIYVSADAITESNGPWTEEAYVARVSIPNKQMERIPGFTPTPGMPAVVMIQTHERTFFQYLTKPITDSMARAFKEH
ncbi:MAG TPA: HlyD family type I secretion periplasmic adaptor subunit [Pararhizobium sp.]|nr:HlyD family type I secretion periplasmic adaptor subunit [Pararhizobium sp.]